MARVENREPASPRPLWVVVAVVAVAAAFGAGFYLGDRAARPDPASMEGIVAMLSEQQREEHAGMTEALAAAAAEAHAGLMPVLAAMAQAMPPEAGAAVVPASSEEAERWRRVAGQALDGFAGFGTGTTDFNGTLAALRGSVQQVDGAAALYLAALSPSGVAPGMVELAATRRNEAVDLWAAGAEMLDGLSVEAGLDHIHLFLPVTGDPDAVPLEFREPGGY